MIPTLSSVILLSVIESKSCNENVWTDNDWAIRTFHDTLARLAGVMWLGDQCLSKTFGWWKLLWTCCFLISIRIELHKKYKKQYFTHLHGTLTGYKVLSSRHHILREHHMQSWEHHDLSFHHDLQNSISGKSKWITNNFDCVNLTKCKPELAYINLFKPLKKYRLIKKTLNYGLCFQVPWFICF